MKRKLKIGVIGRGDFDSGGLDNEGLDNEGLDNGSPGSLFEMAETVGTLLARAGCILINGGLGGVMLASAKGAKEAGGLTIGLLPGSLASEANPFIEVALPTGIGDMRNNLIVRASDGIIAIGGKAIGGKAIGGGAIGGGAVGGGTTGGKAIEGAAKGDDAGGGGLGTLSEMALALKAGKPLVGLKTWDLPVDMVRAETPEEAVEKLLSLLK